ncbi:MAG: hypothetical protein AAFX06_20405 [Planctomycetota bacterium]
MPSPKPTRGYLKTNSISHVLHHARVGQQQFIATPPLQRAIRTCDSPLLSAGFGNPQRQQGIGSGNPQRQQGIPRHLHAEMKKCHTKSRQTGKGRTGMWTPDSEMEKPQSGL